MKIPYPLKASVQLALELLPKAMDTPKARVLMYAIGLQESRFEFRRQLGNGPARGFWQFEKGTVASKGGVTGVFLHDASRYWLAKLCEARNCAFNVAAIYKAIETDDVLAAGVARLLLFTDAKALPELGEEQKAWDLYAKRTWRPGKPHKQTWAEAYAVAMAEVEAERI